MELAAILSPLVGALIAGLFGKQIGDKGANFITCVLMVIATTCSVAIFIDVALNDNPHNVELFTWIKSGDINISWGLYFDQLSAVMLVMVNLVSLCVHVYSIGYMQHDDARARFMSYLSLFTFAMLMLVTSSNFVQLFFGWEGVGLLSYLLIGFWNKKDNANKAAIKAFIVNRVGDFGLLLGIVAVYFLFGSLNFEDVFADVAGKQDFLVLFLGYEVHAISLICFLLFLGAMGKSAQLGLHTWLSDTMEGPIPVSALIHAATMVTAGVFLIARMSPLFEYSQYVREFITVIGALTAFVAATIAITQTDIKKIIAYSTMSQLGYMFFALGVSAYSAAIFHLFTHGFFKALLFLGAGSIINAMQGQQDIRKMGSLYKLIPVTYLFMCIGSLALAGIPYFAGYYSKGIILEASFAAGSNVGTFAYWVGIAAAFMTALYSWRLIFMVFHGKPKASKTVMVEVKESPFSMTIPMHLLTIGAAFSGWWLYELFVGTERVAFWKSSIFLISEHDTIGAVHYISGWVKGLPAIVGVLGIILAYYLYVRNSKLPKRITNKLGVLYKFIHNKWYFDELYNKIFVLPAFFLGRKFSRDIDIKLIDRIGPNGVALLVTKVSKKLSKLQSGYIYHYTFAMVASVVLLIGAFIIWGVK